MTREERHQASLAKKTAKAKIEDRRLERDARKAREDQLLNFMGRYIDHGRWGWYVTPDGKKLANARGFAEWLTVSRNVAQHAIRVADAEAKVN